MSDLTYRAILAGGVGACASPAEALRYLRSVDAAALRMGRDPLVPGLLREVARASGLCFAAASGPAGDRVGDGAAAIGPAA